MSDFIIEDVAVEVVENKYTDAVAALIEAGEKKQLTIVVPRGVKRDQTPGNGAKARLEFQKAANVAGYTARVTKETVQEDGENIALTFQLGKINKRAKAAAVETPAAAEETPEETPEETTEVEAAPEVETAPEADSPRPDRRNRR